MKILLKALALLVVLLCLTVQAHALDKEVQIDILTNKITTLLKADKATEALPYFEELEGIQARLPESFEFTYIDTLDKAGKAEKALERGEAYLKKYGKKGKYYGQVIEVVSRRSIEVVDEITKLDREELELSNKLRSLKENKNTRLAEYRNSRVCSGCNKTKSESLANGQSFPHPGQRVIGPTSEQIDKMERELQASIDQAERDLRVNRDRHAIVSKFNKAQQ